MNRDVSLERRAVKLHAASFTAMSSPCEVLIETADEALALQLGHLSAAEAWRIETKYSRYLPDSVISRINNSHGAAVEVDTETASLIGFATQCYELSGGSFDVTSGVLRKAWRFDGSKALPDQSHIEQLLSRVGFDKLDWSPPHISLPTGMELDFGGIGKEYAVDRVLGLLTTRFEGALLVNFGGDLAANKAPATGPWCVGVERPDTDKQARMLLDFSRGGMATSGDTHRYIEIDGQRYGHILDVRTGWPVTGAPRSVTVAAGSCVEAGLLATLAMLQGEQAEGFLGEQGVQHWCLR